MLLNWIGRSGADRVGALLIISSTIRDDCAHFAQPTLLLSPHSNEKIRDLTTEISGFNKWYNYDQSSGVDLVLTISKSNFRLKCFNLKPELGCTLPYQSSTMLKFHSDFLSENSSVELSDLKNNLRNIYCGPGVVGFNFIVGQPSSDGSVDSIVGTFDKTNVYDDSCEPNFVESLREQFINFICLEQYEPTVPITIEEETTTSSSTTTSTVYIGSNESSVEKKMEKASFVTDIVVIVTLLFSVFVFVLPLFFFLRRRIAKFINDRRQRRNNQAAEEEQQNPPTASFTNLTVYSTENSGRLSNDDGANPPTYEQVLKVTTPTSHNTITE